MTLSLRAANSACNVVQSTPHSRAGTGRSSFGGVFTLPGQGEHAMSKRFMLAGIAFAVLSAGAVALAAIFSEPGRLVVWGLETNPLVISGAPTGAFISLAAGGQQQTL